VGTRRRRNARQENEFRPAALECRVLLDGTVPISGSVVAPPATTVTVNSTQPTPIPVVAAQIPNVSLTPVTATAPVATPVPVITTAPAQAPVGRGRPFEHRTTVFISTVVEGRMLARWNAAAQTYERIACFQKTTTKLETFQFVDPVEYAIAQQHLAASQARLIVYRAEVQRLEGILSAFVPQWNIVQIGLIGGMVVGSWAGNSILDSYRADLDAQKSSMMIEATNVARLQNQVDTGVGLSPGEEIIPSHQVNGWEISDGLIPTTVWAPWCVARGLGYNPPNEFWIDDAPEFYSSRSTMQNWVGNLYDQSNPGGGLW